MKDFAIVYHLHKDNSPVIMPNYTHNEAESKLIEIRKDYNNAYITTNEKADKVLSDFGEKFKPRQLTAQERWNRWALGI